MKSEVRENVIEWITGDDTLACTFTQKRFITRVKKLHEQSTENVPLLIENKDGSIFCHLPLEMLSLRPKRSMNMTEEQKAERYEKLRAGKVAKGLINDR